ncbi:MAG: type II secretion system F family protein [Limnohabitans sp.]|nr:MAG: type II secretion system F family protein [Limnohabitans sp.]
MKLFWYRAMTSQGAAVSGSGEHADLNDLVSALSAQGLQPYRVWSLPSWLNQLVFRPLKPAAVAEFCHLMGHQVRAGADVRVALDEASRNASTTRLRMLCGRLKRAVEKGDTLAQAMEATNAFPRMIVQLVVVGQETGRLAQILNTAATQYEQMRQLRSAIQRSLIYPSIVLTVLVLSSLYWMLIVLPKMTALFESLRVELPPATQMVLNVTAWLGQHGWWLPIPATGVLLLLLILAMRPELRPLFHAIRWVLPGLKRLERTRVYHAFFSHLAAMHASGLTLSRTLSVLMEQPVNDYFGSRIRKIGIGASRGQSLSEGLLNTGAFERYALSLIRLGETTGTLDEQSQRLSDHYALQLKQQIDTGSRLFEPIILLVLAGILLLIGSTMLGPVYEFAARASAGVTP